MDRFKLVRLAVPCTLVLALGVLAACDGNSVATAPQESAPQLFVVGVGDGQVNLESFEVCKFGGTASFDVFINSTFSETVTLADGECADVFVLGATQTGPDVVTVTENVPTGFQLDQIKKTTIAGPAGSSTITTTTLTGTNTVSGTVIGGSIQGGPTGFLVEFFNSPIQGGEGCTPGYWKQPHHFDSWPSAYTPGQPFSSVFEDAFPGKTLLQVLQQGGGGLKALGRHTVAALLNAASSGVSYDLSESDVISGFNAVFPGGDYEGTKNIFARFNEQGCPLN